MACECSNFTNHSPDYYCVFGLEVKQNCQALPYFTSMWLAAAVKSKQLFFSSFASNFLVIVPVQLQDIIPMLK